MCMNNRPLRLLLAAAALSAPSLALAGVALNDARGAAENPIAFDGGRSRPSGDTVKAGSTNDKRTAAQIAADEQILADKRPALGVRSTGADKELDPPKPSEWNKKDHILAGIRGGLLGLLLGSLFGMTGLGLGLLLGAGIGYGMSRWIGGDWPL